MDMNKRKVYDVLLNKTNRKIENASSERSA